MDYIEIVTTFETKENAQRIAKAIIEKRLVACCHINEIESHYAFEGKTNHHPEFRLGMITRMDMFDTCAKFIKANHPYKLPAIVATKIERACPEYFKWVDENISGY